MPISAETWRSFIPDIKSAVYAFLGFLGAQLYASYRNRRIGIYWTATFQRMVPHPRDVITPALTIQIAGTPCINLQACQISLVNESAKDAGPFDLLVQFDDAFVVVDASAALDASGKRLLVSQQFIDSHAVAQKVPESDRAGNGTYQYVTHAREYRFPSLNRGESATMRFLVHAVSPDSNAVARVTSEEKGIRIISRPSRLRALDVGQIQRGVIIGIPVTFLMILAVSSAFDMPRASAISCWIIGAASGAIGLGIDQGVRYAKRLL